MRVLILADKNVPGKIQGRFEHQGDLFQSMIWNTLATKCDRLHRNFSTEWRCMSGARYSSANSFHMELKKYYGSLEPLQVSIHRWHMMPSTEMHIWKYETWKFITTDLFVIVISVTKYRKISSVQYQLCDPEVGLLAKILNKSNVSRCTYYWLLPKLQLFLRTTCLHKLCGMSTGICQVGTMWHVKQCPLKYLNTLEELTLKNVHVLKSATVTCSLSPDACWTQFTDIQVDTMISSTYFN